MPSDSVHPDREPRVIRLSSEEAGDLLTACASATARRLLLALQEDVAPASALADDLDTSLQNIHYHLNRLVDAGAIEIVGTAYAANGREMDLYSPAAQPLVLWIGSQDAQPDLGRLQSDREAQP